MIIKPLRVKYLSLNTRNPLWVTCISQHSYCDLYSYSHCLLGQTFKQLGPQPKSPLDSFHEREVHKLNDQTFKQLGSSQIPILVKHLNS